MASPPVIDLKIEKENPEEGITKLLTYIKPHWESSHIIIKKLSGGHSCLTYTCQEKDPDDAMIVRIKGLVASSPLDDSELENKVLKVVSESGCFEKVTGFFTNGYCYNFIKGKSLFCLSQMPFTITEIQLKKIAKRISEIHSLKIEGLDFIQTTYFSRLHQMIDDAYNEGEGLPNKTELKRELSFMEESVTKLNLPLVLCHGDFHPGNMIWNEELASVTFIDWELTHIGYGAAELSYFLQELEVIEHYMQTTIVVPENMKEKFVQNYLEFSQSIEITKDSVDRFISTMKYFDLVFYLYFIIMSCAYSEELTEGSFNPKTLAKSYFDKYVTEKRDLITKLDNDNIKSTLKL